MQLELFGGKRQVDSDPRNQAGPSFEKKLQIKVSDAWIPRGPGPEVIDWIAGDRRVLAYTGANRVLFD
jgi:hypothetical protein